MADLRSIDLTHNRRFERSVNMLDPVLIKSVENFQHEQLVRRLKKGEILHGRELIDDRISVSITNTTTLTALDNLSNWVVTFSDTIGTETTSWSTVNTNITTTTNPVMTGNNIFWHDTFEDFNVTESIGYDEISNSYNDFVWTKITPKYESFIDTDSIRSRISRNPFHSENDDMDQLLKRIKRNDNRQKFDRYGRRASFLDRLVAISEDEESNEYDYLTRDLINRLDTRPRPKSSFIFGDKTESELKERAPVIKRIYVTNRGRSFDSEQFRFEMVLAEEHYNEAIQKINMKGTN